MRFDSRTFALGVVAVLAVAVIWAAASVGGLPLVALVSGAGLVAILWLARKARGARGTDYYDLAKHVRSVPSAELAVAEAALAGAGPIGDRLVAQLREAPDVWRLIGDDGSYELRVSARKAVRGVPRSNWTSVPIPVRARDGRDLEIRIEVFYAGIISLFGRALDGQRWPATLSLAEGSLDRIRSRAPWLHLPTPGELRADRARAVAVLERWLGRPGGLAARRGTVSIEPPASEEAIVAFEREHAFPLPVAYRELLLVANGFEIGSRVVLGTHDAYRLDIPGPDRLVISPPDEDGAFVLAPDGEVRFVDIADSTSEGRIRASDLRQWVARRSG